MLRFLELTLVFFAYAHPMAQAREAPPANQESEAQLVEIELGHAVPAHRFGNVFLAGQPTAEDIPILKEKGIKTVINLRLADEISWDQATAVEQAGMKYVHVPFRGEHQLTSKVFDKVLGVLRDTKSSSTLLHCATANRVGAIWYAHRVLNDQLDPVEAELEARQVGLRSAEMLAKSKEYVEAQQSK